MKNKFDPKKVFAKDDFDFYPHVAVFDEHEANGVRRAVGKELLNDLAKNCNRKFADVGAAVPLTLGHTKDDAKEEDQPDVVGWAANFDVEPLENTGRDALFADLYIRKRYKNVIDDYPHRSVELWRAKKDISPIALLKTTPERDLPIIKYGATVTEDEPETYYLQSPKTDNVTSDKPMNPEETKMMDDAEVGATSSIKEVCSKLDKLTSMFTQFLSMIQEDEGDDDLLAPEGGDKTPMKKNPMPKEAPPEVEEEKPDEKNAKCMTEESEPEKKSAMANATNTSISSMNKDKEKMGREVQGEIEKYKRQIEVDIAKKVKAATTELVKENAELREHYRRTESEKLVKELEEKFDVDFGDEEEREDEIELFSQLGKESVAIHYDRVKAKYKKKEPKKPDSEGVAKVLRYARQPETLDSEIKDPLQAQQLALKAINEGKSYEQLMKERGVKK